MGLIHKSRLLVVHPEGNILFNSGLMSLVSFLSEEGFAIDYLCPFFRETFTGAPRTSLPLNVFSSCRLFRYLLKLSSLINKVGSFFRISRLPGIIRPWKAVIGIDHDGIILGDALARVIGLPTIFISYEIFFESETSREFKKPEVSACSHIVMAICQGGERSLQLSLENQIPIHKIVDIPVSCRGDEIVHLLDRDLKEYFGITQAHVAVVAGSLDEWALIDELVQSTHSWPAEWALLIHSRYGVEDSRIKELSRKGANNIYFSNAPLGSHEEASSLFCQADLGIALYRPTYTTKFDGKNLAFLGLSSGKTAMYLYGGVPVLTTPIGEYPRLLKAYEAGFVVESVAEISAILREYKPRASNMRQNARRLFEEKIDANLFREKFLSSFYSVLGQSLLV